jgi:hypothetical protein
MLFPLSRLLFKSQLALVMGAFLLTLVTACQNPAEFSGTSGQRRVTLPPELEVDQPVCWPADDDNCVPVCTELDQLDCVPICDASELVMPGCIPICDENDPDLRECIPICSEEGELGCLPPDSCLIIGCAPGKDDNCEFTGDCPDGKEPQPTDEPMDACIDCDLPESTPKDPVVPTTTTDPEAIPYDKDCYVLGDYEAEECRKDKMDPSQNSRQPHQNSDQGA